MPFCPDPRQGPFEASNLGAAQGAPVVRRVVRVPYVLLRCCRFDAMPAGTGVPSVFSHKTTIHLLETSSRFVPWHLLSSNFR